MAKPRNTEPRQLKELRNLMPWTWDPRFDKHPPGESALRDFQNCFTWEPTRGSRRGPRPSPETPSQSSRPKRQQARSSGQPRKKPMSCLQSDSLPSETGEGLHITNVEPNDSAFLCNGTPASSSIESPSSGMDTKTPAPASLRGTLLPESSKGILAGRRSPGSGMDTKTPAPAGLRGSLLPNSSKSTPWRGPVSFHLMSPETPADSETPKLATQQHPPTGVALPPLWRPTAARAGSPVPMPDLFTPPLSHAHARKPTIDPVHPLPPFPASRSPHRDAVPSPLQGCPSQPGARGVLEEGCSKEAVPIVGPVEGGAGAIIEATLEGACTVQAGTVEGADRCVRTTEAVQPLCSPGGQPAQTVFWSSTPRHVNNGGLPAPFQPPCQGSTRATATPGGTADRHEPSTTPEYISLPTCPEAVESGAPCREGLRLPLHSSPASASSPSPAQLQEEVIPVHPHHESGAEHAGSEQCRSTRPLPQQVQPHHKGRENADGKATAEIDILLCPATLSDGQPWGELLSLEAPLGTDAGSKAEAHGAAEGTGMDTADPLGSSLPLLGAWPGQENIEPLGQRQSARKASARPAHPVGQTLAPLGRDGVLGLQTMGETPLLKQVPRRIKVRLGKRGVPAQQPIRQADGSLAGSTVRSPSRGICLPNMRPSSLASSGGIFRNVANAPPPPLGGELTPPTNCPPLFHLPGTSPSPAALCVLSPGRGPRSFEPSLLPISPLQTNSCQSWRFPLNDGGRSACTTPMCAADAAHVGLPVLPLGLRGPCGVAKSTAQELPIAPLAPGPRPLSQPLQGALTLQPHVSLSRLQPEQLSPRRSDVTGAPTLPHSPGRVCGDMDAQAPLAPANPPRRLRVILRGCRPTAAVPGRGAAAAAWPPDRVQGHDARRALPATYRTITFTEALETMGTQYGSRLPQEEGPSNQSEGARVTRSTLGASACGLSRVVPPVCPARRTRGAQHHQLFGPGSAILRACQHLMEEDRKAKWTYA